MLQNQPETAVPRLQPITHREGSATLAPALQVSRPLQALCSQNFLAPRALLSVVSCYWLGLALII